MALPYSPVRKSNNFFFVSGHLPVDGQGVVQGGTAGEQAKLVLENLGKTLEANGLSNADVVKTTVFVTDISCYAEVNAVYEAFFTQTPPQPFPARSFIAVKALPKNALVEIEAIAARG